MIRTKELMQGNIIDKGIVFQICMKEGVQGVYVLESEFSSASKWYSEQDIEPIELTEEKLIEFGFKKNSDVYNLDSFEIANVTNGLGEKTFQLLIFDEPNSCDFYYIHQLQNLYFALTEKELTIKQK